MAHSFLKTACLAPLALLLWQCDAPKTKPKAQTPYAFNVILKFTPMAAAAIAQHKDNLAVDAYYYGDPTPEGRSKADTLGRLVLGEDRPSAPGDAQHAHLDGNLDTSLLPLIRGEPQVLVGVYSITPEAVQDELIACKSWIGTIKMAQATTPVIGCELETGDKQSADDLVSSAGSS